jgi:hypothetical protein
MTKKRPAYLIYLLVFILLLLGASLYVWRDEIASYLFSKDLRIEIDSGSSSGGRSEIVSLEILRDPRVKSLKQQVKIFNYYDLVKSQELIMAQPPLITLPPVGDEEAPVILTPSRVRIGNSNPFVKKAPR